MNIGVIAPESHSHVAAATSLAAALSRLGHHVTYFGFEDVRQTPEAAGIRFAAIAPQQWPVGAVEREMKAVRRARGLRSSILTVRALGRLLEARLQHLPGLLRDAGIEALVADQISPAGGTVAEVIGVPYVNFCNAIHMNYDFAVPPFFSPWAPDDSAVGRARNRLGYGFFDAVRRPMRNRVNRFRRRHGLSPYRGPHAGMSKLCQISQLVPEVDFAYQALPEHFRYSGPLNDMDADQGGDWPVERLDGRPLVYCSFGTVNNSYHHLYAKVVQAFFELDAQLVLSTGGADVQLPSPLPPGAIVCSRVPQRQVLKRCRAFITHCGVNSGLEALHFGVPMVGIPIANDQPGMAARLVHHGAAIALSSRRTTVPALITAVRNVMADPRFRHKTKRLRAAVRSSGGAAAAAEMIDLVLRTGSLASATGA